MASAVIHENPLLQGYAVTSVTTQDQRIITQGYGLNLNLAVGILQRPAGVSDSAGGKTITYNVIANNLAMTRHFYSSRSLFQRDVVGAAGGPGNRVRTEVFFLLRNPPVQPRANDRIVFDGNNYAIKYVRNYRYTMQVDCDLVQ